VLIGLGMLHFEFLNCFNFSLFPAMHSPFAPGFFFAQKKEAKGIEFPRLPVFSRHT
jgi:hypothetical protein